METFLVILLVVIFIGAGISGTKKQAAADAARPANPNLVCSHCNTKGQVTTKPVKQKKGISGGKATGAILTGGVSLLGTGLSRKEAHTEMHCRNCGTTWWV